MSLAIILTSTVVAALVAGIVSLLVSERRIAIENITQERAKWREKIRSNSAEACAAISASDHLAIARLQSTFSLLLNPHDAEDRAIVQSIIPDNDQSDQSKEFTDRVALLLKHDWERAKNEARFRFFRGKAPERTTYTAYLAGLTANNSFKPNPLRGSA